MRELSAEEMMCVSGGLRPQDPTNPGGIIVHPDPGQGGGGGGLPYNPPGTGGEQHGGGGSSSSGGAGGGLSSQQTKGLAVIKAGLGIDLTPYALMSPTLAQEIANATSSYSFDFAFASGGSKVNFTTSVSGTIVIDSSYQNNVLNVVQQLSHEFGHMEHPVSLDPKKVTSDQYVQANLTGEGYATISNERIQHEILAAGGQDIRVATNNEAATRPLYDAEYAKYTQGHELLEEAAENIGKIYGQYEQTGDHMSYNDYYRQYYSNHGGTR